mmetsp:Transcript_37536/g.60825  ORF Transcript_37536/g.60825 Transcript_37536/m.60825 type:complete len:117 (+) Transcript_37536:316-666(+)
MALSGSGVGSGRGQVGVRDLVGVLEFVRPLVGEGRLVGENLKSGDTDGVALAVLSLNSSRTSKVAFGEAQLSFDTVTVHWPGMGGRSKLLRSKYDPEFRDMKPWNAQGAFTPPRES